MTTVIESENVAPIAKKSGRPRKYETDEERKQARRERDKLNHKYSKPGRPPVDKAEQKERIRVYNRIKYMTERRIANAEMVPCPQCAEIYNKGYLKKHIGRCKGVPKKTPRTYRGLTRDDVVYKDDNENETPEEAEERERALLIEFFKMRMEVYGCGNPHCSVSHTKDI